MKASLAAAALAVALFAPAATSADAIAPKCVAGDSALRIDIDASTNAIVITMTPQTGREKGLNRC